MKRGPFALLLCLLACSVPDQGSGDEVMGNFLLSAEPLPPPAADAGPEELPRCGYPEFPTAPFEFSARFSRSSDGGSAFITIGGVERDAGFDGQVLRGGYAAQRVFTAESGCSCASQLSEELVVALLSSSQNDAAGNACPPDPLGQGVPKPRPDGGVVGPATTPFGFDAVRACGELINVVEARSTPQCECPACWMRYAIRGVRR